MQDVLEATTSGSIVGDKTVLANGHSFETETCAMQNPSQTESQDRLVLKVWDRDGRLLCSVEGPKDDELSQPYLLRWLDDMLIVRQVKKKKSLERLSRMRSDPQQNWRFMDFVYFSKITRATGGYGDILPKTSSVRLAVVVQILFVYFLLVTCLNIIMSAQ